MPTLRGLKRRFLLTLTGATLLSLAAIASFNACVDPYGVLGAPRIAGFNTVKPRPGAWIAEIKRASAERLRPDGVVLGNSRAEIGFDPQNPSLRRRAARVYNLAVPGAALGANIGMLTDIAGAAPPRLIIVGLDFLDFLASTQTDGPQPRPRPRTTSRGEGFLTLKALFTAQATWDAIDTVRIQRARYPAQLTELGFNPLSDYQAVAEQEGYYALFRQRAEESAKALRRKAVHLPPAPGRLDAYQLERLRGLLRDVRRWHAEAHFIIYPYHAQLLMMLDEYGLWPAFEDFKRAVMDEVAGAQAEHAQVTLWDFSGPSVYSAQPIPGPEDPRGHSEWYWEAGHFKKALGDVILARVLDGRLAAQDPGFGVRVDAPLLEQELRAQRAALATLRSTRPALSAEVTDLVAMAKR